MSPVPTPLGSLSDQIDAARAGGYSDDEIINFLKTKRTDLAPPIDEAIQSGYGPNEVVDFLKGYQPRPAGEPGRIVEPGPVPSSFAKVGLTKGAIAPPPQPGFMERAWEATGVPELWQGIKQGLVGTAFGINPLTAAGRAESNPRALINVQGQPVSGPLPGVARGVQNFMTGMTTPENLLMMAMPEDFPVLAAIDQAVGRPIMGRLLSAGFGGGQIANAIKQTPQVLDAWQKQDWPRFEQSLTQALLSGGAGGLALRGALTRGEGPTPQAAAPEPSAMERLTQLYNTDPKFREEMRFGRSGEVEKYLKYEGLTDVQKEAGPPPEGFGVPSWKKPEEVQQQVAPAPSEQVLANLNKVFKPRPGNIDFNTNLQRSLPEINQSVRETGQKVVSLETLLSNIQHAKQRIWGQFERIADPRIDMSIDTAPIADAITASVPKRTLGLNPDIAAAINQKAAAYRDMKKLSFPDAQDYWHNVNDELNAFYEMNPTAQRAAAGKNPATANLIAEADALRKAIYDKIDLNQGAAPREFMRRYGALSDLEGDAWRQYNASQRNVPDELTQKILGMDAALALGRGLATGNIPETALAGATMAGRRWLASRRDMNNMLKAAFNNYKQQPVPIIGLRQQQAAPLTGTAIPVEESGPLFNPERALSEAGQRWLNQLRNPALYGKGQKLLGPGPLITPHTGLEIGLGQEPYIGGTTAPPGQGPVPYPWKMPPKLLERGPVITPHSGLEIGQQPLPPYAGGIIAPGAYPEIDIGGGMIRRWDPAANKWVLQPKVPPMQQADGGIINELSRRGLSREATMRSLLAQ